MKKITKIAIALVSMICVMSPLSANAQKGEKTLGVMGGFTTVNDGGFMDVYFQYGIANHFRIAPDLGYAFRNDGMSAFLLDVDLHFPFRLARAFSIYPLVGFTFNNWNYAGDGSASRAGANFGAGIDLNLTRNLKLTLQGKYSLLNDVSGAYFGLGLGYVF